MRYFESSADLCLLEPWLRELGFTCCYGTIILKIYRYVAAQSPPNVFNNNRTRNVFQVVGGIPDAQGPPLGGA